MTDDARSLLVDLDKFFYGWCPTQCSCAERAKPLHDRIAAALAAPADDGDGWRTMETAPTTEGACVLVVKGNTTPIVAVYDRRLGWLTLPGKYAASPTHWRHLPAPPAGEATMVLTNIAKARRTCRN